jgi:hypothetical protein
MSERTPYHQSYYERNRERILALKREKYANDPEYRAKADATTKRNRKRKQALKAAQQKGRLPSETVTMVIELPNGEHVSTQMYTTTDAAEALGISGPTLRRWVQRGAVPKPQYRIRNDLPAFTQDQVRVIARELKAHRVPGEKFFITDAFVQSIHNGFLALNCGVDHY